MLGAASSGPLNHRLPGYRYGSGELWNHSVACASAAQWIARSLGFPNPEEAYVAGLLHDMGKLLLDQYVLADYSHIISLMRQKRMRLWQIEEELFGINHATTGGMTAQKWRFPEILQEAITYHHAPSLAVKYQQLASVINIANAFANRTDVGINDPEGKFVHPEALAVLKIDDEKVTRMQLEMDNSLRFGGSR